MKFFKFSLVAFFIMGTIQIDAAQKLPFFARMAVWTLKSTVKTGVATAGITALVAYGENLKLLNDIQKTENIIYSVRQEDFMFSWGKIAENGTNGLFAGVQNTATAVIEHAKNLSSHIQFIQNRPALKEENSSPVAPTPSSTNPAQPADDTQ